MSARACVGAVPQAPVVEAPGVVLERSTEQPETKAAIAKVETARMDLVTTTTAPGSTESSDGAFSCVQHMVDACLFFRSANQLHAIF